MKYPSDHPAAHDGAAHFRPRRSMLALESRIVFDGAVVAAVTDIARVPDGAAPDHSPDAVAPDAPAAPDASAPGKVLIVDTRVVDYQQIVAAAGAGVTVILIGKDSDGVMQIADALKGMRELDSISIVSHGDDGMLLLGDAALVGGDLGRYSAELTAIGASLNDHGEILLYGCDAGRGEAGRAFLDGLAAATGAVIAASGDATGGASRGGDWDLEIATGAIRSTAAFDASRLDNYDHLLVTTAVSTLVQLNAAISSGSVDGFHDTITLTADISFTGVNDTITVGVGDGHTMTIVGAGHVIDGAYHARVFNTSTSGAESAIEIQNLTIWRGAVSGAGGDRNAAGASAFGGGIFNSGTLTLNGVTLSHNIATGGGGGGATQAIWSTAGGGGSGASGVGGASGGNSIYHAGSPASMGNGGQGAGIPGVAGGNGGTSSGGGAGGSGLAYAVGGNGATATAGGLTIGGGGGGAGYNGSGFGGGSAAGAIYNAGTLTIVGTSLISNNISAGGGGGGGGYVSSHGGLGGRGVGAIWNAGGIVRITAFNYSVMAGNNGASGAIGDVINGGSNDGWSSPAAENNIFNSGGSIDTAYVPIPNITDAQIGISGASGLGGAFKAGDTVTASWDNTAGGPGNTNVTGVTVDFSQFGGGAAVTATNSANVWTASYTLPAGAIDATGRNVSFTATNIDGSTTRADTTNATLDNIAPTATDGSISIAGNSGLGGQFVMGDIVTVTWNNTAAGDNNGDTISGASVDFSQFGGGVVAAANSSGIWTESYVLNQSTSDGINRNVTVSVTDNAGNTTMAADTANATIDSTSATSSITVADSLLQADETSLVTITFSEAVIGFTSSDLTVANGTLGAVSSADGGITWTATLTPTAGTADTSNIITLNNADVQDLAGNTGFITTSSNNYAVDTARPTASIVVADNALAGGETSLVTITFSEAVTGFANADLTVANGTLSAVSSSDGGITWTATLTPTASINDPSNLVTLANTGVQDVAGNTGSGTTDSNNYVLDSTLPTAFINVTDNTLVAGETSLVTITFSEAVTGFANGDLTIVNGSLSAVSSSDGGITWTATLTPAGSTTDASNVITLDNTGVQDTAGNAGSGTTDSNNYAVATVRPTAAVVVADSALNAGETSLVTITFSEAVTGFGNADLTIANGTLSAVSSSDGGATWTATFTPTAGITNSTNVITIDTGGLTNAAGNAGNGATVSNNYAIDTARPTATISVADSSLAEGETSLVTITFSEAVSGLTNADLTVANGTLSAVSSSDGGITWTATLTPTADITDTGNIITLANTGVQDAADNAGSGTTNSNNYAIDTARPAVSIVVADNALAIGETSLLTLTLSEFVVGFDPGVGITIENGTVGGFSSIDGGLTWTTILTPTSGMNDTSNLITFDNTNLLDFAFNGGVGVTSSNNYTLDSTLPTAVIDVTDNALAADETSLVTITFSEAVTGFSNADLTIANGSLSTVSSADGGITWTATLTPTDSIAAATNFIALDNAGVQDVAGNAGSGTTDSNNYAVATVRPTASIVVADSALTVGESALVTITFSEAVTGFTNADLTVDNGILSDVDSADGGITWTAILTPAASINDTSNVIVLDNSGVQNAAGNAGSGSTDSNNYAVNTASRTVDTMATGNPPPMNNILLMPFTITETSAPPGLPVLLPVSTSPLAAIIQEAEGNDYRSSALAEAPGLQTFSIAGDEADDISLTIPNEPILTVASGEAPPEPYTRPAHAPQLSEQLAREARRFAHGSSATLDHLGEIEHSRLAALTA
ncbi:MAG: Ig-like domain-containing protein [Pseudomonadota bacterium]